MVNSICRCNSNYCE